jgi:glycerol-3-phosphate acyltransferase PlsY
MTTLVVVIGMSYLVGAIPWSWLAVRVARGTDLRQVGSGNLGATNTYRALGVPGALLVLVLDMLKGWVAPAGFARLRLDQPPVDAATLAVLAGAAAIAGHVFSVYLRFRGGKGIATTAGVFLALEPRALAIAFVAFAVGVLATRGIVSAGSLLSALVLPFAVYFVGTRSGTVSWPLMLLAIGLTALIWLKHRSNLARLARGEEKRLFGPKGGAASEPTPPPAGRAVP